jgi:transcriptional regulator
MAGSNALIVFTGDHAYVSPDWYGQDDQVGTWNYLSVEAEGPVTHLDDTGATRLLDDLSALFEAGLSPKPAWTRAKMTPGRFEAMLPGIRAFSLVPTRFEGITKLSQNKPQSVRQGVITALSAFEDGIAIAEEMRKYQP